MKSEYKSLLERLTAAHNEKVNNSYHNGELDFIPKDLTTEEMLETIITSYALNEYPETLTDTAETTDDIIFYDDEHETLFYRTLDQMQGKDVYHLAAAYLMTLDTECRKHISGLFDFENDAIIPAGINKGWQTGTSSKTTRLLFNLWNGCNSDNEAEGPSSYYTPENIFNSSYAPYYWQAIKLRYPEYAEE